MDRIEGSVAAILNIYELVINRGASSGVEFGMKFAVLNKNAISIRDPDTGEPLGSLDVPKVIVQAMRIEERLTLCRTYRERVTGGQLLPQLDLFAPERRERETLRLEDGAEISEIKPAESFVKIGDPVVQVIDDEYLDEL